MNIPIIGQSENRKTITLPPRWEDDSLTEYIERAHYHRFCTFVNKKAWFQHLIDIDACFMAVAKDWLNPENTLTPHFFLRSHSSFRSACELATSGQVAATYPLLRICIEYAGYCLHIHKNPELGEVWLRRHDENEEAFRAAKKNFLIKNIKETIETTNQHTAKIFDTIYQRTIDFGAHPNERSITGNTQLIEEDERSIFLQIYLHADGPELDLALKTTAQAGVCSLEILQEVFRERFELLGVREKLLELRKNL